jgi:hypothetical protein
MVLRLIVLREVATKPLLPLPKRNTILLSRITVKTLVLFLVEFPLVPL